MFKISPIQDISLQESYAEMCVTQLRPGFFAYAMTDIDSGKLMGFSQFELEGDVGYIADLVSVPSLDDFEAMFILGRQTMNFMNLCGALTAKANPDGADERLLHAIGFRKNEDGEYICNMTGMFDGKCDGHAVKL